MFTLIGFLGMYFLLGVLFIYLTLREIALGPQRRPRAVTTLGGVEAPA
jgi:cytochrome bd-type quinol oxidase subunit 1